MHLRVKANQQPAQRYWGQLPPKETEAKKEILPSPSCSVLFREASLSPRSVKEKETKKQSNKEKKQIMKDSMSRLRYLSLWFTSANEENDSNGTAQFRKTTDSFSISFILDFFLFTLATPFFCHCQVCPFICLNYLYPLFFLLTFVDMTRTIYRHAVHTLSVDRHTLTHSFEPQVQVSSA